MRPFAKVFLVAAMVVCAATYGFAEDARVTIQNEEATTFYYTVDPPDLAQVTPGSPLAETKVAEFFAAQADEPKFVALAPGAQTTLDNLSDGPHLLVGFFDVETEDAFPVRVITIQADSTMGERFYAIYGSPAIVEATRGIGRLTQFARSSSVQEASTPPAQPAPAMPQPAASVPPSPAPAVTPPPPAAPAATPLASFPSTYSPPYFTREANGDFSVQPIARSRSWSFSGTRISSLSARIDDEVLTLSLTSADGFSPDVSYYIYAFATRGSGSRAAFTLELRPRALPDRGACILWQDVGGTPTPTIFGTVTVDGSTATLVASLKEEPAPLAQTLASAGSFDLTSCWFDKSSGVYEEFFFATVAMADIPVTR
ncbi:MAG TPA: hypothetical protein VL354_08785 [Spirochaetia bacterium]|nr:hypothetical protein [Spirochaetia bacterium]